jgi:hypothetical protein
MIYSAIPIYLAQETPPEEPLPEAPLPEAPLPEAPLPEAPLPEQLSLTGASDETTCVFSLPIYWDNTDNLFRPLQGNPIHFVQGQNWNYSQVKCSTNIGTASSSKELITNTTTGAEFYIDKTITYGDALMFWFLTIFSVGLIFSIIFKFFWRQW